MRHSKKVNKRPKESDSDAGLWAKIGQQFQGTSVKENLRPIVAICLLMVSAYLLYSYGSYIFFGSADQSIVLNRAPEAPDTVESISNPSGVKGAYWMHTLVNDWLGLPVIFVITYIFLIGAHLLQITKISKAKSLFFITTATLWSSLFLTVAMLPFGSTLFFLPGGHWGVKMYEYLRGQFGLGGVIIILITTLLITLFISFKSVKRKYHEWIHRRENLETESEEAEISTIKTGWMSKLTALKNKIKLSRDKQTEDPLESVSRVDEEEHTIVPPTGMEEDEEDMPEEEYISPIHSDISSDIEIEVIDARGQEDEYDEDSPQAKARQLVEEFGPYDPKLDLGMYKMPRLDLLENRSVEDIGIDHDEILRNKQKITETLMSFGIGINTIQATVGPTITLYEVVPESGVKISRIRNLEDDIALSLSALGIRIIAPMPGKGTVGLEVPNKAPQVVGMRSVIASKKFQESTYDLPVALGRTITNEVFTFDLAKVPHLLVAGATGQGKSVGLNAIITSLLYRKHPAELKFVMIDPKMVEFSVYAAIERHYMAKLPGEKDCIITDTKRVVTTLNSLCQEMDDRYELLTKAKVRNLKEYNEKFTNRLLNPAKGHKYMPYIIVIIDEYGDLIMTAGKEIELPIARLAQKARAVGIHAIIATQRPTASIITGTIKANFPGRISFRVFSMIDSRTILDAPGANRLVGKGDLLYSQGNEFIRVQCAFVDTPEVNRIVDFISTQQGFPHAYELPEVSLSDGMNGEMSDTVDLDERDVLFEKVARMLVLEQQGSVSFIQRKFSIGYNRAGRLMDQLVAAGIVSATDGSKGREVLIKSEQHLDEVLSQL